LGELLRSDMIIFSFESPEKATDYIRLPIMPDPKTKIFAIAQTRKIESSEKSFLADKTAQILVEYIQIIRAIRGFFR